MTPLTFVAEARPDGDDGSVKPFPVVCQVAPVSGESQISRELVTRLYRHSPRAFIVNTQDPGCYLLLDITFEGFTFRAAASGVGPRGMGGTNFPPEVDILVDPNELGRLIQHLRVTARPGASMICKPVFKYRPASTPPSTNHCFVIMPFSEAWSDRIWTRHLRPTIEGAGFVAKRADDLFAPGVIVEDIWREIVEADVVVADLTGRNANVFYELGLAHVVGTPVILLTQDGTSFDVAHWRQISYSDNSDGYDKLQTGLTAALSAIKVPSEDWIARLRDAHCCPTKSGHP